MPCKPSNDTRFDGAVVGTGVGSSLLTVGVGVGMGVDAGVGIEDGSKLAVGTAVST